MLRDFKYIENEIDDFLFQPKFWDHILKNQHDQLLHEFAKQEIIFETIFNDFKRVSPNNARICNTSFKSRKWKFKVGILHPLFSSREERS